MCESCKGKNKDRFRDPACKREPRPDQIEKIANILGYEICMLCFAAKEREKDIPNELIKISLTEVFSLHMRNLVEFFCRDNPFTTDYHFADLIGGIKWQHVMDQLSAEKVAIWPMFDAISKKVSHISEKRDTSFERNQVNFQAEMNLIRPFVETYLSQYQKIYCPDGVKNERTNDALKSVDDYFNGREITLTRMHKPQ